MKAMLVIALLGVLNPDGSSNTVTTKYDSWENCLQAKSLVVAQMPNIDLNLKDRPIEADLVAYCVPIKDIEKERAKERQFMINNLLKFLKALDVPTKNDPSPKE